MERCPSGRRYLPRKQANGLFRSKGSNPFLSAKIKGSSSFARVFLVGFFDENAVCGGGLTTK
jgi:hypothetical protein